MSRGKKTASQSICFTRARHPRSRSASFRADFLPKLASIRGFPDPNARAAVLDMSRDLRSRHRPTFLGAGPADYVFLRSNRVSQTIHVRSGASARPDAGLRSEQDRGKCGPSQKSAPVLNSRLHLGSAIPDMGASCPPINCLPTPSPLHFHWNGPRSRVAGGLDLILRKDCTGRNDDPREFICSRVPLELHRDGFITGPAIRARRTGGRGMGSPARGVRSATFGVHLVLPEATSLEGRPS